MENYLKEFHDEDVTNLLNNTDVNLHASININLSHLQRTNPELFKSLLQKTREECSKWDQNLLEAQKNLIEGNMFLEPGFQIKENCHVRFINMPLLDPRQKVQFPNNDNIGQFLQVKGNVVRLTQAKLLEFKREYYCNRCKTTFVIEAEYTKSFTLEPLKYCPNQPNGPCKGILRQKSAQPQPEYCMDFQEIRIQEIMSDKNVPSSLIVTLENDLIDVCQPGECVTICGTLERRWKPLVPGKLMEVIISMRAISVCKDDNKLNLEIDLPEQMIFVRAEWQNMIRDIGEIAGRDIIIKSICPEVHGMYLAKLAVALALSSCTERYLMNGTSIRGHSHLLLVGDPGLAKSRLLKYAAEISARAVHTTGMGCSAAGLTAAAFQEDGEWHLEAGALVLADDGICCIDEFNLIRENDKATIHEAMEQQTISMAKAGMVCRLSTRCVVLAATNPKNLYSMSEYEGTNSVNIGIGGPLLSRFDLVLILRDERIEEWDNRLSDHILNLTIEDGKQTDQSFWDLEKMQSHFLAIKDIHPTLSKDANTIIRAYYMACRADPNRDIARTSVRLLDSLVRLSQAHARLVFRSEVTPIDVIMIIRLMESSFGFGRIIPPCDLIREGPALGPNQENVDEIISILLLNNEIEDVRVNNLDPGVVVSDFAPRKTPVNNITSQSLNNFGNSISKALDPNQDDEELDLILSLDDDNSLIPVHQATKSVAKPKKGRAAPKIDVSIKENLDNNEINGILGSLGNNFTVMRDNELPETIPKTVSLTRSKGGDTDLDSGTDDETFPNILSPFVSIKSNTINSRQKEISDTIPKTVKRSRTIETELPDTVPKTINSFSSEEAAPFVSLSPFVTIKSNTKNSRSDKKYPETVTKTLRNTFSFTRSEAAATELPETVPNTMHSFTVEELKEMAPKTLSPFVTIESNTFSTKVTKELPDTVPKTVSTPSFVRSRDQNFGESSSSTFESFFRKEERQEIVPNTKSKAASSNYSQSSSTQMSGSLKSRDESFNTILDLDNIFADSDDENENVVPLNNILITQSSCASNMLQADRLNVEFNNDSELEKLLSAKFTKSDPVSDTLDSDSDLDCNVSKKFRISQFGFKKVKKVTESPKKKPSKFSLNKNQHKTVIAQRQEDEAKSMDLDLSHEPKKLSNKTLAKLNAFQRVELEVEAEKKGATPKEALSDSAYDSMQSSITNVTSSGSTAPESRSWKSQKFLFSARNDDGELDLDFLDEDF